MAKQLEVIRYRDILTVSRIGFAAGIEPRTLELKGEDLSTVEKVLINEIAAPEFVIIDKNTIFAQLPLDISRIYTVEVLSSGFTRTIQSSKIVFEIGDKTRSVEGILKLVQLFSKWILQSPGSDIFSPGRGGGLQEIVGKITTGRDMQPVFASITRAVSTTTSQIRAAQINVPALPLSERLLSANLVELNIFQAQMEARARVRILSAAGADALSELVL